MTRKNLADLIKLRLGVIGSDTRLDERTIYWLADGVRSQLIGDYLNKFGSDSRGAFMKGKMVPVLTDSDTLLKYAVCQVIDMPDSGGISFVGLAQDDQSFIQTNIGQSSVYVGLESEDAGTFFWQEADRLIFKNLTFAASEVYVRAIWSITQLADDEQIPMPATITDFMIESLVQKINNQQPSDKTPDTRNSPE